MSFFEGLSKKVLNDGYFTYLLRKAEKRAALIFFKLGAEELTVKEFTDLLRFADILSRSNEFEPKNKAYKIISLLVEEFSENPVFRVFSTSILVKLGNFPAVKFLESTSSNNINKFPAEVLLEKSFKEVFHQMPNSNITFTDTQYEIFEQLKNNNHFSFSGPTSLGKSFVIKSFIRFLISEHKGIDNIIILVPTRALINQTVNSLKQEFKDFKNYRVLAHPVIPMFYKSESARYILVFTPERMLAYLSELDNPKIDYLFIDEAHKIIAENDTRSPLYYYSILQAERKSVKLFFASPNIPNPQIFLQLFEKSTDETLAIKVSPVAQNCYFLDLVEKKALLLSDLKTEVKLPVAMKTTDFNFWLDCLTGSDKSIVYCNTKDDTITLALEFAATRKEHVNERVSEVIKLIKEFLHPQYFLINCLRKGIAFHFGSLPQRIRERVERLFQNKDIDYIFCTSTLLEGVNLPARNIFILSNAIGLTKFTAIDFWNLAGRAGRLTKELSGNIICTRIENKKNRWDHPETDLTIIKEKSIKDVSPLLISGKRNFFENIGASLASKPFSKKQPTNTEIQVWNQYANIALIHEIKSDDSLLRSNFISKNASAKKLLELERKKNSVSEKVLAASPMIKAKYQNAIFNIKNIAAEVLPQDISYDTILEKLKVLSHYYQWKDEESGGKNPMYKSDLILSYYATIMNNWINSTPLSQMITTTISLYKERGYYYENNFKRVEFDAKNPRHINIVINQLISDIDNILRFKLKNYFENFYLLLVEKLGIKDAGANWSSYLEYGTSDYRVIELQNIGIPRHLAIFILNEHSACLKFDGQNLEFIDHVKLLTEVNDDSDEFQELKKIFEYEGFKSSSQE